jgi:hypothetical protein
MHPYALTILVYAWNCECFAGNAESGSKCFRQWLQMGHVGVLCDDVALNIYALK